MPAAILQSSPAPVFLVGAWRDGWDLGRTLCEPLPIGPPKVDVHPIPRAPVPDRRLLRGLRFLGLGGLLLLAVAAFTPLANRLNCEMAAFAWAIARTVPLAP